MLQVFSKENARGQIITKQFTIEPEQIKFAVSLRPDIDGEGDESFEDAIDGIDEKISRRYKNMTRDQEWLLFTIATVESNICFNGAFSILGEDVGYGVAPTIDEAQAIFATLDF